MALIRYTIELKDSVLADREFDTIQIHRAVTKYGVYSEITTSGTRPIIDPDVKFYDFDDLNGFEYFWYKWRGYRTADGSVGSWSDPGQGYVPGTTYCGLEEVRRNLRASSDDRRIRFSEFYKNLKADSGNQGDVKLSELSIGQSYSGQRPWTITFINNLEFNVEVGEMYDIAPRHVGTGRIDQDFVANDNSIFIPSSAWSGVPQENDTFRFDTDSHMSTEDAIRYIQDAEIYVDMLVEQRLSYIEAKEQELRFTRDTIPKTLSMATAKFASFFIYSTIYSENAMPGLPGSINDISKSDNRADDLSSWAKQGNELVDGYVRKYTKYFNSDTGKAIRNGPQWETTESLFDATGVYGVGEGIVFPEINRIEDRLNMSYDGLLDYDLLRKTS